MDDDCPPHNGSVMTSRGIVAAATTDPNVLALPTLRNRGYPVKEVIRTLSASVGKNIDIVSVTARFAYPEDAAQIVNAVVRAYIRWHEANRQLGTADLNGQLEKRSRELQVKRKERMMFERRHPDVVENTQDGITPKTLDLLKQELAGARARRRRHGSWGLG